MIKRKPFKFERKLQALEEGTFLHCFGGKDAPDPPDYSGVAAASQQQAQIAQQTGQSQLAWAREQWADQKEMIGQVTDVQLPLMMQQAEMAGLGMDAYLNAMNMQQEIAYENHTNAMQDRDRYERVFQPIEDDLVMEFMSYDTEGRRALEAGRAQSDVARTQDAQRKQSMMELEGYGIDPSQTRSQALDASLRTQQAAAQALAGNTARQRVEDTGRALRAEAINIGKGMPSNVAASYGTALAAGQGAQGGLGQAMSGFGQTSQGLTNNAAAWQGAGNAMGSPNQWMNTAGNAVGQWGNTLNMGYQNQLSAAQHNAQYNNPWADIAGIGGLAMGAFLAEGGEVKGPGGSTDDMISAKLSHGEFVIPDDVVRRKGTEFFEKLIAKTQEDQAQKDAEMQDQQDRAVARQTAMQMGPQQAPMQTGPTPGQAMQLAEGGSAAPPLAPAAPKAPPAPGTQPAQAIRYTGRNPRPMFGYSSELANQEMVRANQAAADRQALMDNLRTEIQNKEWLNVKPDWQPQTVATGAVGGMMDRYYADQEAKRAHELALAQAQVIRPEVIRDVDPYRESYLQRQEGMNWQQMQDNMLYSME